MSGFFVQTEQSQAAEDSPLILNSSQSLKERSINLCHQITTKAPGESQNPTTIGINRKS